MKIITQDEVTALLPMPACIDLMADALRATHHGQAVMPLRTFFKLPSGKGALGAMPAWLGSTDTLGAKVLTVFPENAGTELDSHIGAILLFSPETGELEAVMDASSITAIRTAAVSGLATRLLAKEDAATLAIIGSGVQAATHLEAMRAVRPISEVRVWSPNESRRRAFADRQATKHGLSVHPANSAEEAVRGADLICLVTSSSEPVTERDWISDGAHINAVGAHTPATREVDSTTVRDAQVYVDSRASALSEAGEILIPIEEGVITESQLIGELGEVLEGEVPARRSADEITLFKSLGLAVEDLAAAAYILKQARDKGIGSDLQLGGKRA